MGLLDWECTVCLCPIKSSLEIIFSYPLRMLNENEKLEKNRLSTCTTKTSSLLKQMHNIWVEAEFVRGRESWNHPDQILHYAPSDLGQHSFPDYPYRDAL